MNKKRISYITAFIYTALIGAGMYTSYHINDISYNNPRMVETLVWFEVIMTLFALIIGVKYFSWKELGFVKIKEKNSRWFNPMGFVVFVVIFNTINFIVKSDITAEQWKLFGIVGITTFLVGFSEELVYRGIVFASFIKENKSTLYKCHYLFTFALR